MPKILVVDDDHVFIELMRTLLKSNGYEVITAGEGREGLGKTRTERPDLIILDVVMPVMDGYTMLKEVRKDEQIKNTPIIFCTGKAQKDYIQLSQGMDVDLYMTKPVDSTSLLAKIDELLQ